jgi:spermidine synthase
MKNHPLKISLIIMGISGTTAQIILLRELLISFFGNEITLGVILANWLILEAIGSFIIGKSVEKIEKKKEVYVLWQLIFSLALPFAIYLSRIFKNLLLVTPGEGLGFIPIFYSSLLVLLPVSIPHGALFTYGCKIYAQTFGKMHPLLGRSTFSRRSVPSWRLGSDLPFDSIPQFFDRFHHLFNEYVDLCHPPLA